MTGEKNLNSGRRLHHVGYVVRSIPEAAERFIAGLGLTWDGAVFHDPIQTVRVTFLAHEQPDQPLYELVEPDSEKSRVMPFLKKGGGLHHVCYEVDSMRSHIEEVLARGAILLRPPAPAVAFSGREIAWLCTPDGLLLEYLDKLQRFHRPPGSN